MFGPRFWRLVVALIVLGAGTWAIRESYMRGWTHGYARARCDFSGDECAGLDELGAPK